MADTPCLFGMTNVRTATRVISLLEFWLQFVHALLSIVKYSGQWRARMAADKESVEVYDKILEYGELDPESAACLQVSASILVMYASHYLRKATYTRHLQYVNFWLIVCGVHYAPSAAFSVAATLRTGKSEIFVSGALSFAIVCYMMYVVYEFYVDELRSATGPAAVDGNQHAAAPNVPNGVGQPENRADAGTGPAEWGPGDRY